MTTAEATIQKYLDENPNDHYARQMLADELDDEREEGYRLLGRLTRVPLIHVREHNTLTPGRVWAWVKESNSWAWTGAFEGWGQFVAHALPDVWITAIESDPLIIGTNTQFGWREWRTRREVEDAAALGFARLSDGNKDFVRAWTPSTGA